MPSGTGRPLDILGGRTVAAFLARHWQRRLLLVRGALPHFRDPLSPDELAGLATEPDVDSRLVLERGGRRPWQVVHGPQDPARLRRLPDSHWTLLVERADTHVPALADLADEFGFLPRWRRDDVMVSYAPRAGSVGPHVDRYDVFLLQGGGRRLWRVDARAPAIHRPGLDLRILRSFEATAEWVLEPGDVLYLPPGLAHHGIALEPCFTYSIGFRAPARRDLLLACLERIGRRLDPAPLYEDGDVRPQAEPGEIAPRALARLRRLLSEAWREAGRATLVDVLGEVLTDSPSPPATLRRARRADDVAARVRRGAALLREPGCRAAFTRVGRRTTLFVDGRAHPLPPAVAGLAPLLTRARRVDTPALLPLLRHRPARQLVARLVNDGAFALGPAPRRATPRPSRGSPPARGFRSRGSRP
jgi:50S ribosomal protein L16 3-hydroxylase